jgi:transcriptional regulator with XRE-family HTH domain
VSRPRQSQSKRATRLARLRTERGVSQRELAEATGISLATLRRLERGAKANPPLRYLSNCAIVLGVEVEELIEDSWRKWLPMARKTRPRNPQSLWQPDRYKSKPR